MGYYCTHRVTRGTYITHEVKYYVDCIYRGSLATNMRPGSFPASACLELDPKPRAATNIPNPFHGSSGLTPRFTTDTQAERERQRESEIRAFRDFSNHLACSSNKKSAGIHDFREEDIDFRRGAPKRAEHKAAAVSLDALKDPTVSFLADEGGVKITDESFHHVQFLPRDNIPRSPYAALSTSVCWYMVDDLFFLHIQIYGRRY